jgi:hypothetical protein
MNIKQYAAIGCCTLWTILFIGLRLTGEIAWHWAWVMSPFWIPLVVLCQVKVRRWCHERSSRNHINFSPGSHSPGCPRYGMIPTSTGESAKA